MPGLATTSHRPATSSSSRWRFTGTTGRWRRKTSRYRQRARSACWSTGSAATSRCGTFPHPTREAITASGWSSAAAICRCTCASTRVCASPTTASSWPVHWSDSVLTMMHAVTQLLLIGHSLGGLVIRSACHVGEETSQDWVSRVRHVIYLGSPHLGAPLEKTTDIATNVLGLFNTTATRVLGDVLNTRSPGVKDLRFGNLIDRDWLDCDPDELLNNRRVPVPWLATARHHLVVGQVLDRADSFGDAMVWPESAAGRARGSETGAPAGSDVAGDAGAQPPGSGAGPCRLRTHRRLGEGRWIERTGSDSGASSAWSMTA